jgi:hypothetical protein
MANIVVAKGFWVSVGNATHMQPGVFHNWIWGLGNLNEAITFTAFPLAAFNTGVIIVEDLKISEGFRGRLAEFRVRNVGGTPIQKYGVTGSFIS